MNRSRHIYPTVDRDIAEHARYIGERNRQAGRRFIDAVEKALKDLTETPNLGALCDFEEPEFEQLRFWRVPGFGNYTIFYFADATEVLVIRILHAAQDTQRFFGPRIGG